MCTCLLTVLFLCHSVELTTCRLFLFLDIVIIIMLIIKHFVTYIKFRFATDVTFCIFPFFIDVKFRYMCNSLQIKHDLFRCRCLISM